MNRAQRDAVERLREAQNGMAQSCEEVHRAISIVVDMLTPPDENHRLAIVAVRNPGLSRSKGTCEECRLFKRCEWAIEGTRIGVALDHRTFRPSDGCPWKEEKA